uniref:Brix domain-containing protein n=1 Tax=Schistocephalus solidus TaxID=70667 RepID=A0A183SCH5_SCHSO
LTQANVRDVVMFAQIIKLPVLETVEFLVKEVCWHEWAPLAVGRRSPRRGIEGAPNAEDVVAEMPRYASVTVSRPPPPLQTHFFLFGRDKDDRSRVTVMRYDPRHQRAERVADLQFLGW